MTSTTIQKVQNYQGQNSFVIKMKDVLAKYKGLTPKQLEAVEKCLNATSQVNMEELPEDLKRIVDYKGENPFVKDIAAKFKQYGSLTENQKGSALRQIQKEEDKEKTIRMNWPTIGETIKLGRKVGVQLKEKYGLKFNPILIDITSLKAVSPKAVLFTGKMTVKRGKVCTCCMKTLTDEFSMLTGMGKICAGHVGVEYITDASQAERFREEYLKRVDEIGEMEFWVPKSQIKKWDGVTSSIVETI
jgi:hypothetical protein